MRNRVTQVLDEVSFRGLRLEDHDPTVVLPEAAFAHPRWARLTDKAARLLPIARLVCAVVTTTAALVYLARCFLLKGPT